YLFLGCIAVVYYAYVRGGMKISLPSAGRAALQVVALAGLSTLLFWPYISNYGAGYESLRLWEGSFTHVGNYLVIYGLFLFLIITHLAREWRSWTATWTTGTLAALKPKMPFILLAAAVYLLLVLF